MNSILLTFDLEEFDLPQEFDISISTENQLKVSTEGLKKVLLLLDKHQIVCTFFCTAFYAQNNPKVIRKIVQQGHEIASHLYYHSTYNKDDLVKSKDKLEEITKQKVVGFRSPRLKQFESATIKKAGYLYDSSINPTFIPGRYNHFNKSRHLNKDSHSGLMIMPVSVALFIRFPLFWLTFKNIPSSLYLFLCRQTLKKYGILHLYFHPWEFSNLEDFKIPKYIKRFSGDVLLFRLEKLLIELKEKGSFTSVVQYINQKKGSF